MLIQDLEIRDKLASSNINKFLYLYSSEAMPKQHDANMVSWFFGDYSLNFIKLIQIITFTACCQNGTHTTRFQFKSTRMLC